MWLSVVVWARVAQMPRVLKCVHLVFQIMLIKSKAHKSRHTTNKMYEHAHVNGHTSCACVDVSPARTNEQIGGFDVLVLVLVFLQH